MRDAPRLSQRYVQVSDKDGDEARKDYYDDDYEDPPVLLLNLGDLVACVGLVLLNEEKEVELNLLKLRGRRRDSLGVDLVLDAVNLARENCFHKQIVYIILEIGLRYVYDTFFIDRVVICRCYLGKSVPFNKIGVDEDVKILLIAS